MKNKSFRFSGEQREMLKHAWAKPPKQLDAFIDAVEQEIRYWQMDCDSYMTMKGKVEYREAMIDLNNTANELMKKISKFKYLGALGQEMSWMMDDYYVFSSVEMRNLLLNLEEGLALPLFLELLDVVTKVNVRNIQGCDVKPGPDATKYRPLVRYIGVKYKQVFGKSPSASSNGNFQIFMRHLSDVLGVTIGEDLVTKEVNFLKKHPTFFLE